MILNQALFLSNLQPYRILSSFIKSAVGNFNCFPDLRKYSFGKDIFFAFESDEGL